MWSTSKDSQPGLTFPLPSLSLGVLVSVSGPRPGGVGSMDGCTSSMVYWVGSLLPSLNWGHSPPKLQRGSDLSSLSWLWPGLGSANQSQARGVGPREVPRKAWQLAPLQGFAVPTPPWLQSVITGGSWNVSITQATERPLPPIQCLRVPRFLFILLFRSLQAVEQGKGLG